ncbi:hypothetical protein ACQJBY_014398 [Aegilops geniculata]
MSALRPPWADLPPELLLDVSGRLHEPADFVRFHVVCTSWRGAALLHSPLTRPMFPPWLLTPCDGIIVHSVVNFGGVSTSGLRRDCDDVVLADPPGASSTDDRKLVASIDGTAAWFFTWNTEPKLVNLLTGDITQLAENVDDKTKQLWKDPRGNPRGIIYGDGTVFLYTCIRQQHTMILTAAIMPPGDAAWIIALKEVDVPRGRLLDVAYHNSKIYLRACDKLVPRLNAINGRDYVCGGTYLLESRGDLISASVLHEQDWQVSDYPPSGALLVKLEAPEEMNGDGKLRWVEREGRSLSDHVLYLGSPASFSVDATELGMDGGCAYFVLGACVFRYNFIIGEAKLLERLRRGSGVDGINLWLRPQPAIAPIEEIRERLQASNKMRKG